MSAIDSNVEKKFNEAKTLLNKVAYFVNFLGAWPIGSTIKHKVIFTMYIVYHTIYLSMAYSDLVMVFGNLELMTVNLMETSMQTISLIRMLYMKFSINVKNAIISVEENISEKNYRNPDDKAIYVSYSSIGKLYHQVMISFGIGTGVSWFLMPLQFCFISWVMGQPVFLIAPYKVRVFFFNMSSIERTVLLYIFQSPLPLPPMCYAATINMNVIIMTNICARMAILSNKIKNIQMDLQISQGIKDIVSDHLELVRLAMTIENLWAPIYCLELLIITPLIALVMYNALVALNADEMVAAITLISYIGATLSCLFANCLMGELLNTECERLLDAYYSCLWYNMPLTYRRSLVICMAYAKIPLRITAGKFYIFSFEAFKGILKSSLAYVSLLRTLII